MIGDWNQPFEDGSFRNASAPLVLYWRKELSNISHKATIGEGTVIHAGVHIHDRVIIGKNCRIEAQAFLPEGVTLEDNVFIGPGVVFTNDPTMTTPREDWSPTATLVRSGARLGANATIRAGVTIGEKAVVGCGSVVVCNIPASETWVGNPARKLR